MVEVVFGIVPSGTAVPVTEKTEEAQALSFVLHVDWLKGSHLGNCRGARKPKKGVN
jgi:hypothetical protein